MAATEKIGRLHNFPVIPANAGTQIIKRLGWKAGDANFRPAAPYDLGPGIRRDERMEEPSALAVGT